MTTALSGQDIAVKISTAFPEAVVSIGADSVVIKPDYLVRIAGYLKNQPDTAFDYLVDLTAVDYFDYFELVYRLTSLKYNNTMVIKARVYGREKPQIASLYSIWRGSDLMEREVFDMMGIRFEGHPNMKRIFLWEGFTGHPLRKDYL
jgi:NADH:ubiquinone oxidoreductase subunit C